MGFIPLREKVMKTIVVIIIALITLGTFAYATPISQQWIKTYGGNERDGIKCIQQTMDGGYIAAGLTESFAPASLIYIWVLKFDANGNVSWQKTYHYGGWLNDAYSIQQTKDGGYILGGHCMSLDYGSLILKLDGNGNIVWQKTYSHVIQVKSVQQTADGGYIAGADSHDGIMVLKLDSNGDVNWQKAFRVDDDNQIVAIQITEEGGYVVVGFDPVLVSKLDSSGNIIWQKTYGEGIITSIQQTSDGGYVLAGSYGGDGLLMKLDGNGNTVWRKSYGGDGIDSINTVKQTSDGGYTMIGNTTSFGPGIFDVWVLKLDSTGGIIWQKTYGESSGSEYGVYFDNTMDRGYIMASNTESFGPDNLLMILKLDGFGEIPGCDMVYSSDAIVTDIPVVGQNINANVESLPILATTTDMISQDILVDTSVVCYYENPLDIDGDGVENTPSGTMTSSVFPGSFLAEEDNCAESPNGPYLGTCIKGNLGITCIANEACGVDGICNMNQEDSYPPQGNNIGDSCDCEGDFDCDGDCDGTDAASFKVDFGRSTFNNPCSNNPQCNGDFDCDQDADGTDAALFKADFGRSSFNNRCPLCTVGNWCNYP